MDIASIVQLIVTVGQVIKEIWEGPLGQMIRDLIDGKSVEGASAAAYDNKDLDDIIKKAEKGKFSLVTLIKGIYFLTLAKYTQPKKFQASKLIHKIIKEKARQR